MTRTRRFDFGSGPAPDLAYQWYTKRKLFTIIFSTLINPTKFSLLLPIFQFSDFHELVPLFFCFFFPCSFETPAQQLPYMSSQKTIRPEATQQMHRIHVPTTAADYVWAFNEKRDWQFEKLCELW